MNIEEIAEKLVIDFYNSPEKEKETFRNTSKDDLTMYHHSLGRMIRNEFKLWENTWEEDIRDGVDYSPDHPDQLSMTIIEKVWEEVQ